MTENVMQFPRSVPDRARNAINILARQVIMNDKLIAETADILRKAMRARDFAQGQLETLMRDNGVVPVHACPTCKRVLSIVPMDVPCDLCAAWSRTIGAMFDFVVQIEESRESVNDDLLTRLGIAASTFEHIRIAVNNHLKDDDGVTR